MSPTADFSTVVIPPFYCVFWPSLFGVPGLDILYLLGILTHWRCFLNGKGFSVPSSIRRTNSFWTLKFSSRLLDALGRILTPTYKDIEF